MVSVHRHESGISVIICCYNSERRIKDTLEHLARQKTPSAIPWEIIVVDNASSDNTARIARAVWESNGPENIPFKIVGQPVPGLSYAREKGMETARYEFLLFCDDDNWLSEHYVEIGFKIMAEDPSIGVLGGCGVFEPEEPASPEITGHEGSYVNGRQYWAETDHWVYGAGAIYRKSAIGLLKLKGWKPITTGRKGNKLTAGEDVELCFAVYLLGYKIVASDALLFKHFVPAQRQTCNYILRLVFGQAYSYVLLSGYLNVINNKNTSTKDGLKHLLFHTLKGYAYTRLRALFGKRSTPGHSGFEQKKMLKSQSGTILSLLQNYARIIRHHEKLVKLLAN